MSSFSENSTESNSSEYFSSSQEPINISTIINGCIGFGCESNEVFYGTILILLVTVGVPLIICICCICLCVNIYFNPKQHSEQETRGYVPPPWSPMSLSSAHSSRTNSSYGSNSLHSRPPSPFQYYSESSLSDSKPNTGIVGSVKPPSTPTKVAITSMPSHVLKKQ